MDRVSLARRFVPCLWPGVLQMTQPDHTATANDMRTKFRGCLLGGAVGDALGAPVEFDTLADILARHGPAGVTDMVNGRFGRWAITDDTQMTFFTAEGLLRAHVRGVERGICAIHALIDGAYLRWLATQDERPASASQEAYSYLLSIPALHKRRAPGNTCLSALRNKKRHGDLAANDSKGCGGIMRIAPVGLFYAAPGGARSIKSSFEMGVTAAALTHGHPSGQLPSGVFAAIVQRLVEGRSLQVAIDEAEQELVQHPRHEETLGAMRTARMLADRGRPSPALVETLGGGWVAEEALAIALYCALVAASFEHGVLLAVNHSGDSDSTGSLTGQLLGAAGLKAYGLARRRLRDRGVQSLDHERHVLLFSLAHELRELVKRTHRLAHEPIACARLRVQQELQRGMEAGRSQGIGDRVLPGFAAHDLNADAEQALVQVAVQLVEQPQLR